MMVPFVVKFVMSAPVILPDGASLDAMCAYQGFALGSDGVTLLDTLFAKEGRVHSASWLYPQKDFVVDRAEFVRLQRVGAALNDRTLAQPRGSSRFKIDNKRNEAVNILTTFHPVSTPAVWAFGLGKPSALSELLADVGAIGLKRGNGFGRVERIEFSAVEGWPQFGRLMPDGTPARALPEDEWTGDLSVKRGAYALGFPRWGVSPERCVIPSNKTLDPSILGNLQPLKELASA